MLSKEVKKDLVFSVLFLFAIPVGAVIWIFVGTFVIAGFLTLFGVSL